ncbi:flagellar assembly protein FliH [Nitrosomonas sp.]|uniref:flagellar assembly protein FliH n=1 Tax=Nitrosomonas sp. TaxID=42353 RepID=UPI00258D37F7|nr:flagellar assembly protein FliH [Nitrosomonas sp.]
MEAAYVIPKKELSSWQKWEFGSLDPLKSRQKTESPEKTPHTARSADQPENQVAAGAKTTAHEAIVLPTAEQIEQIYQQAREEGKTAGYQEGMQQAKHAALVEVKHLQSLTSTLEQELKQIDQTMAQDLLTLAIDLARKITSHALEIKPELILPVVEEALRQLPAVSQPIRLTLHPDDAAKPELILPVVEEALRQLPAVSQPIRLTLHPDDAARIRDHLENHPTHPKWHIHEDTQIEPGGCRIESGGCEVDATLATRWQRTLAVLGQEQPWLV